MATLYIDRAGGSLTAQAGVLMHSTGECGTAASRLPIALLERVVIRSDTLLSSSTLSVLCEAGVGVTLVGGRGGERLAQLVGPWHNDAEVRVRQWEWLRDASARAALARTLVRYKLRRQEAVLGAIQQARPDLRKPLFDGRNVIRSCRDRLGSDTVSLETVRGMEGAGAAGYFAAFFRAFSPALGATRRTRRPATDPVNAALSLCYSLLYGRTVHACWTAGLDPAVGALHALEHGRASLACDLMEPWRPSADSFVWRMFAEQSLRKEHFGEDGGGACLLGKAGRTHFYPAWERFAAAAIDRGLRRAARLLVRRLRAHPLALQSTHDTGGSAA